MKVAIPALTVTPLQRLELGRFLGRRDSLATVEEVRAFAAEAVARRFAELPALAARPIPVLDRRIQGVKVE